MKHLFTTLIILLALKTFSQSEPRSSMDYTTTTNKEVLGESIPDLMANLVSSDEIEFSWTDLQSEQTNQFEIEFSTDAIHFSNLQKINSEDYSGSGFYRVLIKKVSSGTTYYRLKKNTFDGKLFYSKIVAIVSEESSEQITIFPNPSVGNVVNFHVSSNDVSGNASVRITGRSGRTIYSSSINGSLDQRLILEQGYYVLVLTESNGKVTTRKIVVN